MHVFKLIRDYVRNAPMVLILSGMAVVLIAIPDVERAVEFQFRDFRWNTGPVGPSNLPVGLPWIGNLQHGLRILGCNWLHWSVAHLFWDLIMFYVIGSLCERVSRTGFLLVVALSGLIIPITVMLSSPEIGSYRGLSGIDTALYALLGTLWLKDAVRERDREAALLSGGLLAAMALKNFYEVLSQQTLFVADGSFTPVPIAHWVGGAVGVLIALLISPRATPAPFSKS
ncbi:MAG: rhomboid family intramembrane serine protease [Pirellula sp.]|jgi:membrane associated rhomboid family serine protease|nr:rhomboid family intramembrane serine protease [Pirellula sp.]